MIPKPFKQITHYNDLLIPKEHINKSQEMNRELWNQLMRINSAFPRVTITVEHLLKDLGGGYYSIDMKLKSRNAEVQKHLYTAYTNHIHLPYFRKSEALFFSEEK